MFASVAREYIREHFGTGYIINYEESTDRYLCFDAREQSGKEYLRIKLPVPDWDMSRKFYRVNKLTRQEICLVPQINNN